MSIPKNDPEEFYQLIIKAYKNTRFIPIKGAWFKFKPDRCCPLAALAVYLGTKPKFSSSFSWSKQNLGDYWVRGFTVGFDLINFDEEEIRNKISEAKKKSKARNLPEKLAGFKIGLYLSKKMEGAKYEGDKEVMNDIPNL